MGTRSRIGVMHGDNVKSVYCHWDGYLEHNGAILQEHYDSVKANQLVALGDLSSLKPEIGEKHAFSQFELRAEEVAGYKLLTENMCTFYGRDRGETAPYKRFDTAKEALTHYDHCGAEYFYLFRYDADQQAGKWFYKKGPAGAWKRLATALSKVKEEEFA